MGLADSSKPITVYKKDAFQGLGCTQLNLFGGEQAARMKEQGFEQGTCNGQGYGRYAGSVGSGGSMGSLWLH